MRESSEPAFPNTSAPLVDVLFIEDLDGMPLRSSSMPHALT